MIQEALWGGGGGAWALRFCLILRAVQMHYLLGAPYPPFHSSFYKF